MSARLHWLEPGFGDVMAARLVMPLGSAADPPGQAGLHQLLAGSLTRGCGSHDARSFAEWIENQGASLRCEAGDDHLQIMLKGVGSDRHVLLPQLLEMVEQPTASDDQIELERDLNLQTLQRLEEDPFSRAQDRLRQLMFGDGPYGHDPLGTTASLQRLSSQDVVNQRPRLANRQAFLVVSAAHDQALADGLERRLQRFAHDSVKAPQPLAQGDCGWSADPLDTEQTVLMLGFRSLPVQHADALGLRLLQVHLGLGMSCRLFLRLREELGLVYDVGAELAMRRFDSPFIWHLSTSADQASSALEALLDEWQRLLDEPLATSQLELSKAKLRGQEAMGRQTGAQRAERQAFCQAYGLPSDFHAQAMKQLDSISAMQLQQIAHRWLQQPCLSGSGPAASLHRVEQRWQQRLSRCLSPAGH